MKVLFCAYDRPSHVATGPNTWLQRLVPDLTRNYGLNVRTLFIYSGSVVDCPTLSFFKTQGLPTNTINREELPYVADQVEALLQIVKKEAIQVVVANLVIPAFYATSYLRQAGIPVIGVMHSNDLFYKGVITKFIHGNIQWQLSHCISVSKYIYKICQNNPTTSQLMVIPCGTPMPQTKASWTNYSVLKVMYAGRIVEEQKQILKLASAFIRAADVESRLKFSIYGDGEQAAQLESMLNEQKENNVTYHGAVAPNRILKCLEQYQVFTLMSDYEGMPVALMEAMACGVVPVCLEESSGVNEIIEHGVNGFIVKDRESDYQKHLQMLLDNPALWQTMSKNAISTINERYSTAITHQQWYQLLQSFAGQPVKTLKIPKRITLEGPLLYYGDNRKPSQKDLLNQKLRQQWIQLRLFIRPRARLRALLKK